MASGPFFLAPPATQANQASYKVHPLVILNILDHYRRRDPKHHRVVGTLLGEVTKTAEGKTIHIKNCFPFPHAESEDQVRILLDFDYHTNMTALQKKLNPKEVVVGWYSTGDSISYTSALIHEEFNRFVKSPVHLVVDTNLTNNRLTVDTYVGRSLSVDGKEVIAQFEKVKSEFHTTEPAKIAVDAMLNGVPDDTKQLDSPATMLSEVENLEHSLQQLLELLETVSKYVDKVNKGEVDSKAEVGSRIKDALGAIPRMDPDMFTKMFNQKTQDLLMILYLSNITQAQVALGNRIYEVLD